MAEISRDARGDDYMHVELRKGSLPLLFQQTSIATANHNIHYND